jgi:hypothetical protein
MVSGVRYERSGAVSTITMDDGKVNALSTDMLQELNAALDQAEVDDAIVVLTGRDGVFSAGFDLAVLVGDGVAAIPMLRAGFELAHRVLSSRRPVIVACSGHAIAMGAFLLLSADYRIGVAGAAHKYTANEVAIGLTMPHAAIAHLPPGAPRQVILLGHSWGSLVGAMAAHRRPDLYAAFDSTGQIATFSDGQQIAHEFVIAEAQRPRRRLASRMQCVHWLGEFGGLWHRPKKFRPIRWMVGSPEYSWPEKLRFTNAATRSFELLYDDLVRADLGASCLELAVPVFMVPGRHDRMAPPEVAERYFNALTAPHKEVVLRVQRLREPTCHPSELRVTAHVSFRCESGVHALLRTDR